MQGVLIDHVERPSVFCATFNTHDDDSGDQSCQSCQTHVTIHSKFDYFTVCNHLQNDSPVFSSSSVEHHC
jgi:hypothetical protein